jgi:hypothetical protein
MPIWQTGALPPSPPRAGDGGGKCPTASCSNSQRRYAQITIFVARAPHRVPSRAWAVSAHRELAPGFAWAAEPGPWAAAQAGRRAGLCRRTNPFPVAWRGEKPLVSECPARFQEFRAQFRELLYDWAWSPPVIFPWYQKSIVNPALSRISPKRGVRGILSHPRQRPLMPPRPLSGQNPPGDRCRQKVKRRLAWIGHMT